jgi:uncharacterized protein YbaP (TraB family)
VRPPGVARCYLFGTILPSAPTVISCDWLPVITVIESYFVRLKPADVQNAPTTLKQAVAIAEQKAGGKCYLFGTILPSAPTVISCDWLPVITVIL